MQHKRSQFFIDKEIHGPLVFRVAYYWALCVLAMFVLLTAFPIAFVWWRQSPDLASAWQIVDATWRSFCYPTLASALLLPLLTWDIVRLSHRYVGPLFRLRNALRDLGEGKPVAPIQFRQDDVLGDLAEQVNEVAARLRDGIDERAPAEPLDDSASWEEESPAV